MLTIPNEVTSLLKTDGTWKNFRVHFPNGERSDITNDNVVSESVSFTESICSEQSLKLGLCETPYIEFETFGVENIKGDTIECSMEVDCEDYCEDVEYVETPYYGGTSVTSNGVTYTVNNDGSISTNGTASGTSYFNIRNRFEFGTDDALMLDEGWYYIDGCPDNDGSNKYGIQVGYGNTSSYAGTIGNERGYGLAFYVSSTISAYAIQLSIQVTNGKNVDGFTFKPSVHKINTSSATTEYLEYPFYETTKTASDVTYTDNADGTITVSGTASGTATFFMRLYSEDVTFPSGLYKVTGCPSGGGSSTYRTVVSVRLASAPTTQIASGYDTGDGLYIYLPDECVVSIYFQVYSGTATNFTITPTFERLSIPFEQTCPITDSYYASDIGKWVYSIPYGKFVVDSCKKQADMTHRRVIAYNRNLSIDVNSPAQRYSQCQNPSWYTTVSTTDAVIRLCEIANAPLFTVTETEETLTDVTFDVLYDGAIHQADRVYLKAKILDVSSLTTNGLYRVEIGDYLVSRDDVKATYDQYDWVPYRDTLYYPSSSWYKDTTYNGETFQALAKNIPAYKGRDYIEFIPLFPSYPQILMIPYEVEFYDQNGTLVASHTFLDSSTIKLYSCSSSYFGKYYINNEAYSSSRYYIPTFTSDEINSILEGMFELDGLIGRVTREGYLEGVSLASAFASPVESLTATDYETLWYDDYASKEYGRITCTYTDTNNDTQTAYYDMVAEFEFDEYAVYDISDNYFIQNGTWSISDINTILATIGTNLSGVTYMPTNLTMLGRPDLEAGDVITVTTLDGDTVTTWLMQRNLDGIMALFDDITAQSED